MKRGMSLIVRTVARLLFPFMLLFGIYVVLHGHITPGGGFPGGVIIAASIVMLLLSYGYDKAQETISSFEAEVAESIGGIIIVGLGLTGVIVSLTFLQEVFPLGEIGNLFSGGNLPILNIGVGIKVAAGFVTIFYAMLGIRGEES